MRPPVDPAAEARLRPHLAPDEPLIWAGFPAAERFTAGHGFGVFMGITITSLTALFGCVVWFDTQSELPIRLLWGSVSLVFMAGGLGLFAPHWRAKRLAAQLVYGATPDRLLIVRDGKDPLVRAYGPADLGLVQRENGPYSLADVLFTVDADPGAVMPSPLKGGPAATSGRVGFIGVPAAALQAAEAVRAARAPGQPAATIPAASGAARLDAHGSFQAGLTKLDALQAARRAAQQGRQLRWSQRHGAGLAAVMVVPPALGFALADVTGLLVGLIPTGWQLLELLRGRVPTDVDLLAEEAAELSRFAATRALLVGFQKDAHPKARLHAAVDFGPARAVRPWRFAASTASGALKTWHRHRWARFRWAAACGSALEVALIDQVKYKSGADLRHRTHVRGWLVPNPSVWGAGPDQPFTAGPLQVTPQRINGLRVLRFRGPVAGNEAARVAAAGLAIEALFAALAACRPPADLQPEPPLDP